MLYNLSNGVMEAQISDFGAKITRLVIPNDRGERKDVVLGFATEEEWHTKEPSFNAVIGRCANRIKNAQFELDGRTYHLLANDRGNTLHGGDHGFNIRIWEVEEHDERHVRLHYRSADGEEGFPGNLDVWVTYTVTADNALRIAYEAKTDAPTLVNLTNHAYFNLEGEQSPSVCDHVLQVLADTYTPLDETDCPTGEIRSVEGTPMDFRQPIRIGDRIEDPFFVPSRGINHNWCVPADKEWKKVAVLHADGRTMEVYTTSPALQVYTGNWVEANVGKSGTLYRPLNSICLETQNCPDAIHHANFPSPVLRPGEVYKELTEYRFVYEKMG